MKSTNFTTMLHKRTNKITRVLTYVVLEWTLILFLLLNSLFSYLILKFAVYFGLKRPCLFCSRLDHVLDSEKRHQKGISCYEDIICEQHAAEVSKFGYCSNHRKLVESNIMCDNCSNSTPEAISLHQHDHQQDVSLIKWMKKIGIVEDNEGEDDMKICCCCCDVIINTRKVSSSLNFMANLITEREFDGCFPDQETGDLVFNQKDLQLLDNNNSDQSDFGYQVLDDVEEVLEAEKQPLLSSNDDGNNEIKEIVTLQNLSPDMLPQHLEFYVDHDDYRLIPVDQLINGHNEQKEGVLDEFNRIETSEVDFVFEGDELMVGCDVSDKNLPSIQEENEEGDETVITSSEKSENEENIAEILELQHVEEEEKREIEDFGILQKQKKKTVSEFTPNFQVVNNESEALSNIQSTSTVYNEDTEFHHRSDETETINYENVTEEKKILIEIEIENEVSTITDNADCEVSTSIITEENEIKKAETETEDGIATDTYAEIHERNLNVNVKSSSNDVEDDRFPDTPTSVESYHQMHKKLFLLGRRGSATEESLDGSIIIEQEGGDAGSLIEKLRLELQSERKALRALYSELEEERNASAIAANQTMAMITRLQEEKATMQMEALQYQRMMEEQAEYDQEALQMMNELMVKREKEKQELEKELEVYRKKVMELEEREKIRILSSRRREGSMRSGNSSASCSPGEESEELSIDFNNEVKDQEEIQEDCHQGTPNDAVIGLDDSLASFENERISILEQLKLLEEKLFTLADDEEEQNVDNMRSFEEFCQENGNDFDDNCNYSPDENVDGFEYGKIRCNGSTPKRLLPLFDAADELLDSPDGNGDIKGNEFEMVLSKSSVTKFEFEKKKLAIEEEVDHVYERLQALEADREFLKHCIGSLRKGDKGLDLLQEILQHLRDLKNVELQVMKNMEPCSASV